MGHLQDVRAFHEKFGVENRKIAGFPDKKVIQLRLGLIEEEMLELEDAIWHEDIVATADALADLLYVTYGAALAFGIDIDKVWDAVHTSNMTKVGGGKRSDGKIMKPEGWEAPDIREILFGQE